MGLLDNTKAFETLTNEERDILSMFCQQRVLSENEVLFNEGEESTAIYVLKSGKLEITKSVNGSSRYLGEIKRGEFVGEMALFEQSGYKRMASARAIEESEVIIILFFSIKDLLVKHPAILNKIKAIIEKRKDENRDKGVR